MTVSRRAAGAMAFGAILFAASCASMKDVQDADVETAATQSFNADYRKVADAGISAINGMKLTVSSVTEEADGTVILFQRPGSFWQIGAVGRMVIDKNATPPIPVHINYEKRGALTYSSGQERWARAIFTRMEKELSPVAAK
jgi:hypothetical protein